MEEKLKLIAQNTNTDYWNDSCSASELQYAISNGAVGATTNPVIVTNVLNKEMSLWKDDILKIIADNPSADEDEIAWRTIEAMAVNGAKILKPVFEREKRCKGFLSIQTNAKFYRNPEAMIRQAVYFSKLAPNMQVKMPVTQAGVKAIGECTYQGVNVNATVCFSVPQALAVGEAIENALQRRKKEGLETESLVPVCTIMLGRVDDWLKVVAEKRNILVDPSYLDLAGVAVMKRAAKIYQERGYKTKLLGAAYRNFNHVAELIGGGVLHTIPYKWQVRYNGSDMRVENSTLRELNPELISVLKKNFEDFNRAYEPDGMKIEEFDYFGPTRRTLRQFIGGYDSLLVIIRNLMIPDPDTE